MASGFQSSNCITRSPGVPIPRGETSTVQAFSQSNLNQIGTGYLSVSATLVRDGPGEFPCSVGVCFEEEELLHTNSAVPETKTTSAAATLDESPARHDHRGDTERPFQHVAGTGVAAEVRFSPSSLGPGANFSLRRFSITEGALLFSLAYIASKMLGLIRQVLFNALFGTGAQATAYYAAFRLPDTLFNLIAGGALISAFLPIFVSYETQRGDREAWRLASLVFNVMLVS